MPKFATITRPLISDLVKPAEQNRDSRPASDGMRDNGYSAGVDLGWIELSDEKIVELVLLGHQRAFEVIVRRYQKVLNRLAISRVHSSDWAEEIVQETFLNAFKSIHTFDSKYSFKTWIWTIMFNQCRRIGARNQKRQHVGLQNAEEPNETMQLETKELAPIEMAINAESAGELNRLLELIPVQQANAIRLRFFGELKFREIAEVMQCSLSAAKQRVRFGLEGIANLMHSTTGRIDP